MAIANISLWTSRLSVILLDYANSADSNVTNSFKVSIIGYV